MKIAVMGAGGVGAYFGAQLQAAGHDVWFIARGVHLDAMRADGLRIESKVGAQTLARVHAVAHPAEVGPVDVVMFTVKMADTRSAAEICKPLLKDDTAVISFQNGVDAERDLSDILGERNVVGGVSFISARIEEPGFITHVGELARLVFGELDGSQSTRVEAFLTACKQAGIDALVSDDIHLEIWKKFVFLAGVAGVCCLTRQDIGTVRGQADTRACLAAVMEENAAVGRAAGVALPSEMVENTMTFIDGLPGVMKPSTLVDLERGKPLEIEWLSGATYRLGKELNVATPVNSLIRTALIHQASGATQGPC